MRKMDFRLSVLVLGILLSGCGSESKFTVLYEGTFKKECAECHVATGEVYTDTGVLLDFTSQETAYKTLTEGASSGQSSDVCAGVAYVVKSKPDESYLAAVLFEDKSKDDFVKAGCTPYNLHHSDVSLKAEEKEAILKWITDGANND